MREYIKYVSNNIISMIGLSFYILVDTYFISVGVGANGLAALNIALPLFTLISGIGIMLGVGGGSLYNFYKERQDERMHDVYTLCLLLAGIIGIICFLLGLFMSDQLAILLGANQEILKDTSTYIYYMMLGAILFMANNITNNFVKNDGNPTLSMIAMISGSLINIVFDYIFIFIMNMGMKGAILATLFSPTLGLCILSTHFIRKNNQFSIRKIQEYKTIKYILRNGFPSFISEICQGIILVLFNYLLLNLSGNVGVAAYGIIANVNLVVIAIYNGIAQGSQPLYSKYYALNDLYHLKLVKKYSYITVIIISIILYYVLEIHTSSIVQIFNETNNKEMALIAINGMRLYFIGLLFTGMNITHIMYDISINNSKNAQLMSLLRSIILVIPVVLLLSTLFKLNGLWISITVVELIVFILEGKYQWTQKNI